MEMQVFQADSAWAERLAPLFDAYRVFYGQTSDVGAARAFLADRLKRGESVVIAVGETEQQPVGFVQLYPSFSSVSLRRIWVLNDLFVGADFRRQGIGKLLMDAAFGHAARSGAVRVVLATASSNTGAQILYERCGYSRDTFLHYEISVIKPPGS